MCSVRKKQVPDLARLILTDAAWIQPACGTLFPTGRTGAPVSEGGHPDGIGTTGTTVRPLRREETE